MVKKIIISIILILLVTFGGYYVYKDFVKKEKEKKSHFSYLPSNNLMAIVTGEELFGEIHQFFSSSVVWKELSKDTNVGYYQNQFLQLDTLLEKTNVNFQKVTLGVYQDSLQNLQYKVIADIPENDFNTFINQAKNMIIHKPNEITEVDSLYVNLFNKKLTGIYANKKIVLATHTSLLQNVEAKSIELDKQFQKVYVNKSNESTQLFFNFYNTPQISKPIKNLLYEVKDGGWSMLNLNIGESDILLEGLVQKQSTFKASSSQLEDHLSLLPTNVEYFSSISGDSLKKQINSQIVTQNDSACKCNFWSDGFYWLDNQVLHFSANFSSDNFLAFRIKDRFSFEEGIRYITTLDTTYILGDSTSKMVGFTPKIRFSNTFNINFEPRFYIIYNDYAILSKDKAGLQKLWYNIHENQTLKQTKDLASYLKKVANSKAFSRSLLKGFLYNNVIEYDGFSLLEASQKSQDMVYLTYRYSTAYNIGEKQNDALWSLNFKTPLYPSIHLVKNHRVDDKEILVQDTNNVVYLVSAAGEIKWTYKLNSPIIGEPKTIDIYQNGKYQMLFNTRSKIYVIDVLGRDVKGFPVALNNMTNPVNVFDYDDDGNYRIFVSAKDGIFVYDKEGAEVKGWKQPLTDYDVTEEIRFLRVGGKDYILANDNGGEVYLYSRQGDIRQRIDKKFTAHYFPVDLGNNILNTRAIYPKNDKLIKHFFDNKKGMVIYANTDSIYDFKYAPYLKSVDNHWYISSKTELKIVNKSGEQIQDVPLQTNYKNLQVNKGYIYYLNPVNEELVLYDLLNKTDYYYNEAESYAIDDKFDYDRLIIQKGNKLQMVIHQKSL